jgi:hypothetical protein
MLLCATSWWDTSINPTKYANEITLGVNLIIFLSMLVIPTTF